MKYKLIEKVPIPIPRHKNKKDIGEKIIVKAQTEKEYLILDLFRYKRYISRYVLNTETGEYAGRYEQGDWNTQKLIRIMILCMKVFIIPEYLKKSSGIPKKI